MAMEISKRKIKIKHLLTEMLFPSATCYPWLWTLMYYMYCFQAPLYGIEHIAAILNTFLYILQQRIEYLSVTCIWIVVVNSRISNPSLNIVFILDLYTYRCWYLRPIILVSNHILTIYMLLSISMKSAAPPPPPWEIHGSFETHVNHQTRLYEWNFF